MHTNTRYFLIYPELSEDSQPTIYLEDIDPTIKYTYIYIRTVHYIIDYNRS